MIALRNYNNHPFRVARGMSVAQLIVQTYDPSSPVRVSDSLLAGRSTVRGAGGFGSTGRTPASGSSEASSVAAVDVSSSTCAAESDSEVTIVEVVSGPEKETPPDAEMTTKTETSPKKEEFDPDDVYQSICDYMNYNT